MDELELSEVMHHGEDGGQTVIVVQGQHGEGEEVYPGFKFVSPAPPLNSKSLAACPRLH